jgi:hypothetical protein
VAGGLGGPRVVGGGLRGGGGAGERCDFQQGAGRAGAVEAAVGDDGALVGAPGAAVTGVQVLDEGGAGLAERGCPVPGDAVGVAGVGQDVAERDAVAGHGRQHGGERGDGVVAAGRGGHAAGGLGHGRALLVRHHDGVRQVVAEEQLVLVVAQVVLRCPQDASGSAQLPPLEGGGLEKDCRSLQSTASDLLAFLSSAGMEASSRSSQVRCSNADGSPSGSSLPSALVTRRKVYSACRQVSSRVRALSCRGRAPEGSRASMRGAAPEASMTASSAGSGTIAGPRRAAGPRRPRRQAPVRR